MNQPAPQHLLLAEGAPLPGQDGLGAPVRPPVDFLQAGVFLVVVHLLVNGGDQVFDKGQGRAQVSLIGFVA